VGRFEVAVLVVVVGYLSSGMPPIAERYREMKAKGQEKKKV